MDPERELAVRLLEAHPREAAQAVEGMPVEAVAGLLASAAAMPCARMLAQMAPEAARRALAALPGERAAALVDALPPDVAGLFLRGLSADARRAILEALPAPRVRVLQTLLRFAEGTAGALMDAEVLALPEDLSAGEAIARVREAARAARYNLYVVDREQRLVGVLNQRELLMAPRGATLGSFMSRNVHRIPAHADRVAVVSHPAWREVHALPVVDGDGVYLGAVRYRTFRALEESLRAREVDASLTARALGDLFRTGAEAVLDLLSAPATREGGPPHGR